MAEAGRDAGGGDGDFVTLRSYLHPWQARVALGLLESAGIEAMLVGEHHASMNWLHASALGGVQLRVRAADAQEADALLATRPDPAPDDAEDGPTDAEDGDDTAAPTATEDSTEPAAPPCPACSARRTERTGLPALWAAGSYLLLGVPLLFTAPRYRCGRCGHRWKGR